ncbi:hypothetical protein TNCV_4954231 [Trichonephila clavipes]|nr:hypothetical protein TNCV_4954231 [Trichonephila clavipes]
MPLRHWGTLNSRRATGPLIRLVEGKERWEAPAPKYCSLKLGWHRAKNRTATFTVLKATANDRRPSFSLP